eukprot:TRINITY_DN56917_c0_g1_i1.p2 TRINITY_DN56917_c0_g1~~TRINITY_DN56917_c0_g1_i1.p2  ORF type:complete len:132 (-),score=25.11 TRINITY_DN56917_c0_g1_i1:202-597(-)
MRSPLRLCSASALWVHRLEPQLYRVGPSSQMHWKVGGIQFVDFVDPGTFLVVGRPFGMVEGPKGQVELVSPFNGEVLEVNDHLKTNPGALGAANLEVGWIAEIDSFIDDEDDEAQWEALDEYDIVSRSQKF